MHAKDFAGYAEALAARAGVYNDSLPNSRAGSTPTQENEKGACAFVVRRLGLGAGRCQGEGIAPDDVAFKKILNSQSAILRRSRHEQCAVIPLEDIKEPVAAFCDIVFQNIYAIN